MKREEAKKINTETEEKEFTYEDFTKTAKDIFKDWAKGISKENFEMIQQTTKSIKEYENKIDELASNYPVSIPHKQLHGYYEILEYCLRKIKKNDEKYKESIGFGCISNLYGKEN